MGGGWAVSEWATQRVRRAGDGRNGEVGILLTLCEVPSILLENVVEVEEEGLLLLDRKGHVVLDSVESAEHQVEDSNLNPTQTSQPHSTYPSLLQLVSQPALDLLPWRGLLRVP